MYLAITAVLALASAVRAADAGPIRPGDAEARLLDLINADRVSHDLPRFQWDAMLARLARDHAADMARSRKVSHTSSTDGADFVRRLIRIGLRASAAAENVALDRNVLEAHRSLMDSPRHRANILDPDLLSIGIGVEEDTDLDVVYVVEDFASTMASLSAEGAVGIVRTAIRQALESTILPPIEDRALCRRLSEVLSVMVAADSVDIREEELGAPAWMIAYTTPDPSRLPDDARSRVHLADSYAFAVTFARTESYPLGIYWVLLTLRGARDDLTAS